MVHEFEDNQLSVTNINNTKSKSETWFWSKYVNKNNLIIEKNRYSNNSDKNKNKKKGN